MPIGDATEALDTLYAYYRLPEDGFEVIVAGPEARLYHTVLHEIPPNPDVPWDITQELRGQHGSSARVHPTSEDDATRLTYESLVRSCAVHPCA